MHTHIYTHTHVLTHTHTHSHTHTLTHTHTATISVNWTMDFEQVLVQGVTGVSCVTPLPTGMSISADGVLSLTKPRLSLAGRYICQLSPTSEGNILVDLEVNGTYSGNDSGSVNT